MQINAQSSLKSPWLDVVKQNNQTPQSKPQLTTLPQTDTVTLSQEGLNKASDDTDTSFAWPAWPKGPSQSETSKT